MEAAYVIEVLTFPEQKVERSGDIVRLCSGFGESKVVGSSDPEAANAISLPVFVWSDNSGGKTETGRAGPKRARAEAGCSPPRSCQAALPADPIPPEWLASAPASAAISKQLTPGRVKQGYYRGPRVQVAPSPCCLLRGDVAGRWRRGPVGAISFRAFITANV